MSASMAAHPPKRGKGAGPLPAWKRVLLRGFGWIGIGLCVLPLAGSAASLGALKAWIEFAPPLTEFEAYDPPKATLIQDRAGQQVATLFEQRRFVVPIGALPPQLPEAFISIEDERFRDHFGIDLLGILRAAVVNVKRGRAAQGASTITQQTARNLLPRIGRNKTATRKVLEVLTSLLMENRYSKDQILEVYLNQIYLGSGNYGVQAASMSYFGVRAADLGMAQAATLAGLPQAPERLSPLNNPELAENRRSQVLTKMIERGVLSEREFRDAVTAPLETTPNRFGGSAAAYFVDAVRRQVSRHPSLDGTELNAAGWIIRTTLDATMQRNAEEALKQGLVREEQIWIAGRQERFEREKADPESLRAPKAGEIRMARVIRFFGNSLVVELPGGWKADVAIPAVAKDYFAEGEHLTAGAGVDIMVQAVDSERGLFDAKLLPENRLQGAVVVLDRESGDVRALVGGRDYFNAEDRGFFNRAVQGRRQAGSTLKPILFAAGLERGLRPSSTVMDSEVVFADGYAPKNYDRRFVGPITLSKSFAQSRNIPTIRVVETIGLRKALDFVARFQRVGDTPWRLPLEWPTVLGTTAVSPLELAAAYQALANGGEARGPRLVEGVWNDDHRETLGFEAPAPDQLIGGSAQQCLVGMMRRVMIDGTGRHVSALLPPELRDRVAGKSGTTDDNRDSWFAGFTPWEVVVVYIGFDTPLPLAKEQTGGRCAGSLWADVVSRAWSLKTEDVRSQAWPFTPGCDGEEALVAAVEDPDATEPTEPTAADVIEPDPTAAGTEEEVNYFGFKSP